jgi:hypothetical protein
MRKQDSAKEVMKIKKAFSHPKDLPKHGEQLGKLSPASHVQLWNG